MSKGLIIACDFAGAQQLWEFLAPFEVLDEKPYVKVGMELYYAAGPDIVRELKARGYRVFLDLKMHDIPNTVRKAANVLGRLGADIINVHAAGGSAMMAGALEGAAAGAAEAGLPAPLVIAVTQLTSTDQTMLTNELLIDAPLADVVSAYAKNVAASGLSGVVCSAQEAAQVHEACGENFLTVCPGVRPAEAVAAGVVQDQKRVMTPAAAAEAGADFIVVGRPITQAADSVAAYSTMLAEFMA